MKFDSLEAFKKHRETLLAESEITPAVWICGGPGCAANGSAELLDAFTKTASLSTEKQENTFLKNIKVFFQDRCGESAVRTGMTGCMGPCENSPVVHIEPWGWYYYRVKGSDAEAILHSITAGIPCERLTPRDISGKPLVNPLSGNIPYLAKQRKLILGHMHNMSPLDLDGYIRHGGYSALVKALGGMTPEDVCREVETSGLRGRGGGGFPTGIKWNSCRKSAGTDRYVLVNGDEGDPGAFMDRSLMEGDPYAVIEGLTIGAYAIGAKEGIIYVRHEYPLAVEKLRDAIKNLNLCGLLGDDILGTGFSFHVDICKGGGAFVCGESTALMTSIEGRPGVPRVKYVRSTEKGLWEAPTVLNNVETWANIPLIINNGAEWFKGIGTENNSGTKIFALVGKVKNTGLVEVPMGTTLREIIYDIGGGVSKNRPFKAVQTGGPSGGCLPERMLDTPVDFDSLTAAGSMMGSGGMIVMDDRTCMVDVARYFIDFLVEESCGKCVPCREGLKKMQTVLHDLTSGAGAEGDTERLKELAYSIADTALCALGQSAANPVLSTIEYFPEEYAEHERKHFCRAGVCRNMFSLGIIVEKCSKCGLCMRQCPVNAIERNSGGEYLIKTEACIGCGMCIDECPFAAIEISKGAGFHG